MLSWVEHEKSLTTLGPGPHIGKFCVCEQQMLWRDCTDRYRCDRCQDYLQMYSANSPVIIGTPKGLIGGLSTLPSSSAAWRRFLGGGGTVVSGGLGNVRSSGGGKGLCPESTLGISIKHVIIRSRGFLYGHCAVTMTVIPDNDGN